MQIVLYIKMFVEMRSKQIKTSRGICIYIECLQNMISNTIWEKHVNQVQH